MELLQLLGNVDLFTGLELDELAQVADLCTHQVFKANEVIAQQGSLSDELYIIAAGLIEVQIETFSDSTSRAIVQMGEGQILGEMGIIDHGPRSATLRAISNPTKIYKISRTNFESLCEQNTRIGYLVMRNLAVDLSFKLRHRNIRDRGQHERL